MPAVASEARAVASRPQVSEALRKLRNGEIGIEEYLDIRADAAVVHLTALLSASDIKTIRDTIRAQLTTDPVLIDLIRRATGHEISSEGR